MRNGITGSQIVSTGIPGGEKAEIVDEQFTLQSETNDSAFASLSLTDFDGLPAFEPGEQLTFVVDVRNTQGAFLTDEYACDTGLADGVTGTAFKLVAVVDSVDYYESPVQCIPDKQLTAGDNTDTIFVQTEIPDEAGLASSVLLYVAVEDGTRVTPQYKIPFETVDPSEGEVSDTEDTDPDDDTFDAGDESFTFDVSEVDSSCTLSKSTILETGSAEMDVNLSYTLPPGEDSVEVPINYFANTELIGTGTAFVTVNGSTGSDLKVSGLTPGEYEMAYAIGQQDRRPCGTLTVEAVFTPEDVTVSCSRETDDVATGEPFDLTVTATNDNHTAAQVDYDVLIGGAVAGSDTITVSAQDQQAVNVPVVVESGGEFEVGIEATVSKA